jgi:hypothetical protein
MPPLRTTNEDLPETAGFDVVPNRVKGRSLEQGEGGVGASQSYSNRKKSECVSVIAYQNTPIRFQSTWRHEVVVVIRSRLRVEERWRCAGGNDIAKDEMADWLLQLKEVDEWFKENPPVLEWFGARWVPGAIDVEHELMNALVHQYRRVAGQDPVIEASPWGTDGGLLTHVGETPAIVFGPGVTEVAI